MATYFLVFVDCEDAYNRGMTGSGVYTIKPDGLPEMRVWCEQELDGGGSTVGTILYEFQKSSTLNAILSLASYCTF